MRRAYQIICHIIAACVVIQAAVIAWSTFSILNLAGTGGALSEENAPAGLLVHSVVGQMVIPLLAIVLLIVALVGRAGIRWAAWLLLAVLVQLILGYSSFELPGLGLLHGINAFVILGLAEIGARSIGSEKTRTKQPAAERTAMDDSA